MTDLNGRYWCMFNKNEGINEDNDNDNENKDKKNYIDVDEDNNKSVYKFNELFQFQS